MRKIAFPLSVILGAAATAWIAGAVVLCEATLFVPHGSREVLPANRVGEWRDVHLTASDGVPLVAWFAQPTRHSDVCVMVIHGIRDSREGSAGYASLFLGAGYNVLLPDSRGHGASGGNLVTYGIREKFDAASWIAWLRSEGCRHVFGLGESLGGAVLIQAAAVTSGLDAIVAECSYSDLESVADYRVAKLIPIPSLAKPLAILAAKTAIEYAKLRYGVNMEEASPITAIARTKTPILLIHGLADSRTPPSESRELANRNPRAVLWLVPGAEHVSAYSTHPEMFRERVLRWFAEHANKQ